jgi:hypothetical protein
MTDYQPGEITQPGGLLPLPNQPGEMPLAVAYTDKNRSLAVLYPQRQQPAPEPPQRRSEPIHPLIAAVVIFMVGLGLAVPIATLGVVLENIVVEGN